MAIIKEPWQLDWLKNLVARFPEVERPRKNFMEIAGYPSWENVNSNLLAFYLDEKEDHRMERLFLNSLLELVQEKLAPEEMPDQDLFATDYTIERESDYIDILLRAEMEEGEYSWALIIENKIYHHLHNDLEKYWKGVEAANKLGVVLSLYPLSKELNIKRKKTTFVNITHRELVQQVRQKLPEYFDKADDRHLLFLKEYFANIESHYKMEQADAEKEQMLQEVQQHKEQIAELNKNLERLQRYVQQRLDWAFQQHEFEPKNTYLSKAKSYYKDGAERKKGIGSLRFWVNVESLLMDNELRICLELCGEGVQHGEAVKKMLEEQGFPWGGRLKAGTKRSEGYFHLAFLGEKLPAGLSLDEGLKQGICLFFEKRVGEKSLVEMCLGKLKELLQEN